MDDMREIRRVSMGLGLVCIALLLSAGFAAAQSNSYLQMNLSSDTAGTAHFTSMNLVNPWGIAYIPGNAFWIADNNSGKATLYDKSGNLQGSFTVPPPQGSSHASTPTGIVANTQGGFAVAGISSQFLFATEDGTISGWYSTIPEAILAVDHSSSGAVYKGLALVGSGNARMLLAANFNSGAVEAFDSNFAPVTLQGMFVDPTLPAGYAPFGIHVVNNQVLVTFAQQDALKHDPVHAAGAGYASLFDLQGVFVRRVASQGTLNAPWGATVAPATFGMFPGALLIGNFGDGTINAFDVSSSQFLGQLQDAHGNVITNPSLWELLFDPSGQTGDPNTLYLTAGLNNEQHGLFAAVTAASTQTTGTADFSIAATPTTMTISAGQTASFTVSVTALNGFNSAVNFSCSGEPAGTSCTFNPNSVTPSGANASTAMLTIGTSSNPYRPYVVKHAMFGTWVPVSALGLLGMVVVESRRRRRIYRRAWWRWISYSCGFVMLLVVFLGVSGCGGYNNNTPSGTQRGTATVVITATSGITSHSANVTLTVQ